MFPSLTTTAITPEENLHNEKINATCWMRQSTDVIDFVKSHPGC